MAHDSDVAHLKSELKSMQNMFQQLTEENREESYDIRRAYMLKAQVIQLERQCMLLSEALSCRESVMHDIENEIIDLTGEFQQLLAHQGTGPTVPIARKSLVSHIQRLQKLKGSLIKQSAGNNLENLSLPQISGWKFAKTGKVSCLDVCSGNSKHLNMQHVAKLELNLSKLYKQLVSYQTMLCANFPVDLQNTSTDFPEKYLYSKAFTDVKDHTESCIHTLDDCCTDLLSVSLLHPSAPWAVIQKPEKYGMFKPDEILLSLPSTLHRRQELKNCVNSLCKLHSYYMHMNKIKMKEMQVKLEHSAAYHRTQTHYMNSLLKGVVRAYTECEKEMQQKICLPLQEVVGKWFRMKESQSDETLRQFLTAFKQNENVLRDFTITKDDHSNRPKAFEELELELKQNLNKLKVECAVNCDKVCETLSKYTEENEEQIAASLKVITRK